MDKQFWISIQENEYTVPAGYDPKELNEELFSYLGSTDPELRDTVGLEVYWKWLMAGHFSLDYLRTLTSRLIANLEVGLGEKDTDTVFLRSFTCLWLGGVVDYDNQHQVFQQEEIMPVFEAVIAYLPAEIDTRGTVEEKGWAHAIAHAGDLLTNLARSRHTGMEDHLQILDCIADKLNQSGDDVYLYSEDCRLVRPVLEIFKRGLLDLEQIEGWLTRFSAPWRGAWENEHRATAFFNARNFIRCLFWYLGAAEDTPNKEILLDLLREKLNQARPWEPAES